MRVKAVAPCAARLAEMVGREYISSGGLETGQQICERCKKEVDLTLSIGQKERGEYECPGCGGKKLQPLMATFFSQTSRKA